METLRALNRKLDSFMKERWCWIAVSCVDLCLSLAVVKFVPYTEIDWRAYMQEVEGPLLHNDWNYTNLRGDTGPLVYPAGFVYAFMALRWATDNGTNILRAQYIFSVFHALLVYFFLGTVYYQPESQGQEKRRVTVPFWVGLVAIASRRIHSIFALRLFNDGVAMLILYMSSFALVRERWTLGCVLFTLALSIKMNIILFLPGLAVVLLETRGVVGTACRALLCLAIQVALAVPFLLVNPLGYLERSFELGRVFQFKWTVNFKFLPEEVFVSKELALGLMASTLVTWVVFGQVHFAASHQGGLVGLICNALRHPLKAPLDVDAVRRSELTYHICLSLFTSNFIGVAFSRSIHYQFYSWYFHTLAFLMSACMHPLMCAAVLVAVEVCYNIFPATPVSSAVLQVCHFLLLFLLWRSKPFALTQVDSSKKTK